MLFVQKSLAMKMDYSLGSSVGIYSNINLENDPTSDEGVISLFGTLSLSENTSNLVGRLDTIIEATNYYNDLAEDDVTGMLVGEGLWIIEPRKFEWYMADTFTQTVINIFESSNADNTENANAFVTGPNYFIRLKARSNIALEARYMNFNFEESTADNVRYAGAMRWLYELNSSLVAGLNYEQENTDYEDNQFVLDHKRKDAFASLSYKRGINTLDLEAGRNEITDDSGITIEGYRYGAHFESQRTSVSNIRLGIEQGLNDTGSELLDIINDPLNLDLDIASTSDFYRNRRAYVRYRYASSFFGYDARALYNEDYYPKQPILSEQNYVANLIGTYNLSNGDTFTISGEKIYRKYINTTPLRTDWDTLYSVQYSRNIARRLSFNVRAEKEQRDSSDELQDYVDNRLIFTLEYTTRLGI